MIGRRRFAIFLLELILEFKIDRNYDIIVR